MIEKILNFTITDEMINGTSFEQISAVSQQPYFITGFLVILGISLLIWFIIGFFKVGNKMVWSSWIHKATIFIILIIAILVIGIFIFPIPTYLT